jgi:predicted transglutaminase-like cysteine proteinase
MAASPEGCAMTPDFARYVPIPAHKAEAGWDSVKTDRLDEDPCPEAVDAAAVNAWVNQQVDYLLDPASWQTPSETLGKLTGDCKDYAVLKRAILLAKGFAEDELFLVVGQDTVMNELHAVMWTSDGVMDNFKDDLLSPDDLEKVFTPEFAFREGESFIYGVRPHTAPITT